MKSIPSELADRRFDADPEQASRCAIRTAQHNLSYAELETRVEAFAAHLRTTPEGTTVGLRLGNVPAFLVACLACLRARRPVVLLDVLWKNSELSAAAQEVQVDLLVQAAGTESSSSAAAPAEQVFDAPTWPLHAEGTLTTTSPPQIPPLAASSLRPPADTAIVHWSSGSTGIPKSIPVSRDALHHRLHSLLHVVAPHAGDRMLCVLPLSHCHGIECLAFPTLLAGASLVLMDPLAASTPEVVTTIAKEHITLFSSLPRFYMELLEGPYDRASFADLRVAISASAALEPEVAAACSELIGIPVQLGYGLTEIGVVCLNRHLQEPHRFDSVGPVLPGIEWRIEASGEDAAADGVGELFLRGPGFCNGKTGWQATGDWMRVDADGFLYYVGRTSAFLNINGAKVDPTEVERCLAALDWVKECAVKGVTVAGSGEKIAAYVVPRSGADLEFPEQKVQLHVAETLSIFKVPTFVTMMEALPRSTVGKVRYTELPTPLAAPSVDSELPSAQAGQEEERRIAAIWSQVLGIHPIPLDRSFTDLGGTSVQLLSVLEGLHREFDGSFDVVDMFRYPTVRHLAAAVRAGGDDAEDGAALEGAQRRAEQQRAALRRQAKRNSPPTG